jgi:hypothetical protein
MKERRGPGRRGPPTNKSETALQHQPTLGREIQAKIGEQLGVMYNEIVKQGVPQRFEELLKQFDKPGEPDRS